MITVYYPIPLYFLLLLVIYFVTRQLINQFFYFFRRVFRNDKTVFAMIAVIFLPGTVIHEFSHMVAALLLLLRVYEIKIFPEWEKNYIKLGRVLYSKADVLRGILVGIAPVFGATLFFWWIVIFKIFPSTNLWLNILMIYLIFSISSSMFSSKQDLIDLIYIIPLMVIAGLIIYVFGIDVRLEQFTFLRSTLGFFGEVNLLLLISAGIDTSLLIVLKLLNRVVKY